MKLALHWKIVIGMLLGVVVGLALYELREHIASAAADSPAFARAGAIADGTIQFVGQIFLRALQFIAVPIVFFSLIMGAASLGDPRKLGKIGLQTVAIYFCTCVVAVTIGLALANAIKPGKSVPEKTRVELMEKYAGAVDKSKADVSGVKKPIWQTVVDIVPKNPFNALANANMLQVVVFGLAIGVALTMIPKHKAAPIVAIADALTEALAKLVQAALVIAPYAVFALLVPVVATMGYGIIQALAMYVLTVVLGLALVIFVEYGFLIHILARVSLPRFLKAMAPAQLLAFSSSSSNATLPVTMQCVKHRLGVSDEITDFVCPLGATINLDGTALYQGVATMFIAQMVGIDLNLTQQLTIVLTATLATLGTPGIPGAGIVMLVIVLQSVGVPAEGIAVILGVDRLLDMCRTIVNVTGDAVASVVIARWRGEPITPRPSASTL
ncbi:MAG: dicarboxylate/amino acid:cation symporter [Phycisphaerales bacterium]|nr:dicarboxylate/amino acid:cation symporter [Phycisphaerales bacterium]